MAPYTLIIIDMQDTFLCEISERTRVLDNTKKAIVKAISDKQPIIIVEFDGSGATNKSIRNLANKYKNCYTVKKYDCDGSMEICKFFLNSSNNFPKKILKFCGVYSSECLHDTVIGLMNYFENTTFKIIEPACGDQDSATHKYAMGSLRERGALIVKQ